MIHTTLRKKHQQKCQRQMLYLLDKFIKKSFLVYKVTLQSVFTLFCLFVSPMTLRILADVIYINWDFLMQISAMMDMIL